MGAASIYFIDLHGGSSGTSDNINSNLDGVVWTLGNGDIANVNLVPEPASIALIALGGLALLGKRRRRD